MECNKYCVVLEPCCGVRVRVKVGVRVRVRDRVSASRSAMLICILSRMATWRSWKA